MPVTLRKICRNCKVSSSCESGCIAFTAKGIISYEPVNVVAKFSDGILVGYFIKRQGSETSNHQITIGE